MTTFAERLKNAMEQANMSQSALSEQAGASKASISQYLSGKNIPNMDRMNALADATGVTVAYLMGYGVSRDAALPIKNVSIKEAARCMGKSDQFVRIGLQRGILPFGKAVPGTGGRWNYYINPEKFKEFIGVEQFSCFFGKCGDAMHKMSRLSVVGAKHEEMEKQTPDNRETHVNQNQSPASRRG